jgi:squalene synthase HpnC
LPQISSRAKNFLAPSGPAAVPVEHYENFPVASLLLPRHLRHPIEVIYAFARSADDFADEGERTPAERFQLLDDYARELDKIASHAPTEHALFRALGGVIHAHQLPIGLFHDLLGAFKQDITKTRYADFDELMDYCRRSADPIGRLLLHLNRAAEPQHLQWSDAICSALQLINHWQDVAIDWKKNEGGRVYLPQDEMAQFGVSERDIADQTNRDAWQKMMSFQCARARALLMSGAPLTARLGGRFGAELRLIVAGGARILDKIDAVKGDVFRHRPALNKFDWLMLLPRVVA